MSELDTARKTIDEIDREMAVLFERRMDAVSQIATYKRKHSIPTMDAVREEEVLRNNTARINNAEYRPYYERYLRSVMTVSKDYQRDMCDVMHIKTAEGAYPIHIGRGLIQQAGELFNLHRKVLVVTDSGVPEQYAMTVASQCADAVLLMLEQGEKSKSMDTYSAILKTLSENAFTRTDCVVAVGGGVVGDVAGFTAATYMRGVDFYVVPTTLLAQVDAAIGGKTAVNYLGYKNSVGVFSQPKGVLIDMDTLLTLPRRHISNGMAEVIKMALTHDAGLFSLLEDTDEPTEEIIKRALTIKKRVVELDERDLSSRQSLNFGHTLGHGIENVCELLHGECVSVGMLPMCSQAVRDRLIAVLHRWDLPTTVSCRASEVIDACRHDKKCSGDNVTVVTVSEVGHYDLSEIPFDDFQKVVKEVLDK